MKTKKIVLSASLLVMLSTSTFASQLGIAEKIQAFVASDLKPILAIILFAAFIVGILFNIGKLNQDNGWKPFAMGVLTWVLIAAGVVAVVAAFQGFVGNI